MLAAIKSFFGLANEVEMPVTLDAKPLEINPGSARQLARHVGRLANLYNAKANGDERPAIDLEITQRKSAITAYGHAAPIDEVEARKLFEKLEKAS